MSIRQIEEAIEELRSELKEALEEYADEIEIYEIRTELNGYYETLDAMKRKGY